MVIASTGMDFFISSGISSTESTAETDSPSLVAALPVGADRAILRGAPEAPVITAISAATVRVFPVPGPPEITRKRVWRLAATATFCQSGLGDAPPFLKMLFNTALPLLTAS